MAAGLKHPGRAQNVGVEGCQRILVRRTHQRKGRHMDDHLGRELAQRFFKGGVVVDVRMPAVHQFVQAQAAEHGRRARRVQGNAHDLRPQHVQPHGEPASLEARMPGDEHAPAVVKLFQHGLKMHRKSPCPACAARADYRPRSRMKRRRLSEALYGPLTCATPSASSARIPLTSVSPLMTSRQESWPLRSGMAR